MSQLPTQYNQTPAAAPPSNGIGTTGFVLGLVGLVLSPIPFISVVAWPLVVLGIIFSAIGIAKVRSRRATNKGLTIAGLVMSIIGLGVCLVWVFIVDTAQSELDDEANRQVTITYEVTGDAPTADIDYTTYGDDVTSSADTAQTLPWSKEVTTKGLLKGGSLIVTTGEQGGTVTCRVLVDDEESKTATAEGPFAVASCTDF